MKKRKGLFAGLLCMALILALLLLSSCGVNVNNQPGSRSNPLTVGETGSYHGASAKQEGRRFDATITLEDVCRGEDALEIFTLASIHSEVAVPDGMELLMAKVTFGVTKSSIPVPLGVEDVDMFLLVSGTGVTYEKLLFRRQIDQNIFSDMYEGGVQTGNLFFWVAQDGPEPMIAFCPQIKGGVWFKTTIPEDFVAGNPISKDEWSEHSDKLTGSAADWENEYETKTRIPEGNYAGTLKAPLPVGEWGLYTYTAFRNSGYVLEMKVTEMLRGEAAETVWGQRKRFYDDTVLKPGQELLALRMTMNLLEYGKAESSFSAYRQSFTLVNQKNGTNYSEEANLPLAAGEPGSMYAPGTQDFYLIFAVDCEDTAPLLSFGYDSDKLWFNLEASAVLPVGFDSYQSLWSPNALVDASTRKGSLTNPFLPGEDVPIEYEPNETFSDDTAFCGSIAVLNTYIDQDAAAFFKEGKLPESYDPTDKKLVVLEVQARVDEIIRGNEAPDFSSSAFAFTTGGNQLFNPSSAEYYLLQPLENVYEGKTVTGYLAFFVDAELQTIHMAYGNPYDDNEKIWIAVELSSTTQSLDQPLLEV